MITVVMTTWDDGTGTRAEYAMQSIRSLCGNLDCEEPTKLLLADDGTENAAQVYAEHLEVGLRSCWLNVELSTHSHNGIGSSLNHALKQVDDLWLYTVDDWVLTDILDIDNAIGLLRSGYDYVRLGPIHPNLECVTRFQVGIGYWLDLCNTGGYAFATRPFLATKAFYEKIGPFLEGANSYVTEQDYALRCARKPALKMASIALGGDWEPIGDDYPVGKNNI